MLNISFTLSIDSIDCSTFPVYTYILTPFGIKEYLHLERFDKAVMASLIESAKVMGEDRLEVTWKHQDVYEKILGEMQE